MTDDNPLTIAKVLSNYAIAVRRRWAQENTLLQRLFDVEPNLIPAPISPVYPDEEALLKRADSSEKILMYGGEVTFATLLAAILSDTSVLDQAERPILGLTYTSTAVTVGLLMLHKNNLNKAQEAIELKTAMVAERHWYQELVRAIEHDMRYRTGNTSPVRGGVDPEDYVLDFLTTRMDALVTEGLDPNVAEIWLFPGGRRGVHSVLGAESRSRYATLPEIDVRLPLDDAPSVGDINRQKLLARQVVTDHGTLSIPEAAWRHVEAMWARANAQRAPWPRSITASRRDLRRHHAHSADASDGRMAQLEQQLQRWAKVLNVEIVVTGGTTALSIASVIGERLANPEGAFLSSPVASALAAVMVPPLVSSLATISGIARLEARRRRTEGVRLALRHELTTLADLMATINHQRKLEGNYALNLFTPSHRRTIRRTLIAAGMPPDLVHSMTSERTTTRYASALEVAPPASDSINANKERQPLDLHAAMNKVRTAFDVANGPTLATIVGSADDEVTTFLSGVAGRHQRARGKAAPSGTPVIERALDELSDVRLLPALAEAAAKDRQVDNALATLAPVAARTAIVAIEQGIHAPAIDTALTLELERGDGRSLAALAFFTGRTQASVAAARRTEHAIAILNTATTAFANRNDLAGFGQAVRRQVGRYQPERLLPRQEALRPLRLRMEHGTPARQGEALRLAAADARQMQAHLAAVEQALADEVSTLSPQRRTAFGQHLTRSIKGFTPGPALQAAIDRDDPPAGAAVPTGPHTPLPKPHDGRPQVPSPTNPTAAALRSHVVRAGERLVPGRPRRRRQPRNETPVVSNTTGRATGKAVNVRPRGIAGRRAVAKAASLRNSRRISPSTTVPAATTRATTVPAATTRSQPKSEPSNTELTPTRRPLGRRPLDTCAVTRAGSSTTPGIERPSVGRNRGRPGRRDTPQCLALGRPTIDRPTAGRSIGRSNGGGGSAVLGS